MPLNVNASELIERKKHRKIFIETGSADGDGIECALKSGFEEIYSIELNPVLFENCKEKFKDNKNVYLFCGSSEIELPKILETINEPFVLWLDAHWSGGDYIGELMDVYLPKELNSIKDYSEKFDDSVIMIDDMNHYMSNQEFCKNIENLVDGIKKTGKIEYCESLYATHLVKS
jgi:hypothetical protein